MSNKPSNCILASPLVPKSTPPPPPNQNHQKIHLYIIYIYASTQSQEKFFRRALVQLHVLALLVEMHGKSLVRNAKGRESRVPPAQLAGVTARYAAMEEKFSQHQGFDSSNMAE